MQVFIIVLNDDVPEDILSAVQAKIDEHYPENYGFAEKVFLVSGERLTETIAEKIGIKGKQQIAGATGAVFKLNGAYAGYTTPSLWEWLASSEEHP